MDAVDTVRSGHSGIVVFGGEDNMSLVQKGHTSGCSGHSGCSGMQWSQYAVDAVDIVVYGGGDIVFGAKRSNQWMQWTQYTVDIVILENVLLIPMFFLVGICQKVLRNV